MRAFPSSWAEKKRYVLIESDEPVRAEQLVEQMSGMLGLVKARPVQIRMFSQDSYAYTIVRITRGFEDLLRASLILFPGYARVVCMSGSLRGLRRKALTEGIRIPT